jgi:hypothetical protein
MSIPAMIGLVTIASFAATALLFNFIKRFYSIQITIARPYNHGMQEKHREAMSAMFFYC